MNYADFLSSHCGDTRPRSLPDLFPSELNTILTDRWCELCMMYTDRPQYEVYGYCGDGVMYHFSHPVDERRDAEMIEQACEFQEPDYEKPMDFASYADIFYCDRDGVTLVGTWVTDNGEAIWHAGGWTERPKASKENALRFLYERGRPA